MPVDRLADLIAMSQKTPHKPIVWYGLAMEHRSRGNRDDALAAFKKCLEVDPGYVPAYFQGGMTLDEQGKRDDAVAMLKQGVGVARQKGDKHAASEMQAQLEMWGED
ncbi:MAG: tetratricopeptide repeat protein [Myxococcota bacterium]